MNLRVVSSGSDPRSPRSTPAPLAWADGRVLRAADATVPLTDPGFLRGDGIFEGIMVRGGRTHALDRHLARMRASAKLMQLRLPLMNDVVRDLLAAWGDADGAMKLVVTRAGTVRGLIQATDHPDAMSLAQVEMPWRTSLSGAKTLSYAANMWASREAVARHADDALITTDDVVMELPTGALVWHDGERFRMPDPAKLPILSSITAIEFREVFNAVAGVHPISDVLAADAVWVLSATRPALPVFAIDDVELDTDLAIHAEVRERFDAHIDAHIDR